MLENQDETIKDDIPKLESEIIKNKKISLEYLSERYTLKIQLKI